MLLRIVACVAGLTALGSAATAETLGDMRNEITNGSRGQDWVVHDVIVFKSATGGCAAGDMYTFRSNGDATHIFCKDRRLAKVPMRWKLTAGPYDDIYMLLAQGNKIYKYVVELGDDRGGRELRLQSSASNAKIADVREIKMIKARH